MSEKNLPTISELYKDEDKIVLARQNDLNLLLNQEPKKSWLKDHPTAKKEVVLENGTKKKVPIEYIPIERVEWLMTNIFIKKRVEVIDYKLIGNSVTVHIRLHYKDPITNEWDWEDGLGACPLQTDSGAGAIEFDKLKNSAVMIALPAAESYAVKDAAEKLGKLFGKDLNRADQIMYDTLQGKFENTDLLQAKKAILNGLAIYKGEDVEKLKKECADMEKQGKFDMLFAEIMANKIGVKL